MEFVRFRFIHGGVLVKGEKHVYIGGNLWDVSEPFDIDKVSLLDLRDIVTENLKYSGNFVLHFRQKVGGNEVFRVVDNDRVLMEIVGAANENDFLELCVEHIENIVDVNDGDRVHNGSVVEQPNGGIDEGEDISGDEGEDSDGSIDFDDDVDGSDVNDEFREAREIIRHARESRKKSAQNLNVVEVQIGEAGVDDGFDGFGGSNKYAGKTGNDEPYDSSDPEDLVDSDEDGNPVDATNNRGRCYDDSSEVPSFELGLVFENVQQFRHAVSKYAILKGVSVKLKPNESQRVRVKCKKEGCPWLLYAGVESKSGNFVIKTYNPRHKCFRTNKNHLCNSDYIAKHFERRLSSQPDIKLIELQRLCREELKVHVGRTTCLRAKNKVMDKFLGDNKMEYARLLDYVDEIKRSNPGTTCFAIGDTVENGTKQFRRFYVCYDALRRGFLAGVRPIIGMDGCHLKGVCAGVLLVAVSKDGNNQMFPFAWGVVAIENKENWKWFISCLKNDLSIHDGQGYTTMTDMQKGLEYALQEDLPLAEHRKCARHVFANWAKKWRGLEKRKKFWECAWSTFEVKFKDKLEEMNKIAKGSVEDLITYEPKDWCKAYFRTDSKCDTVDNNMCETFNGYILSARCKSIITMNEEIRVQLMNRMTKMRDFTKSWISDISPIAMAKLEENKVRAMSCHLEWNGDMGFEITDGVYRHTVDLNLRKCTCREWELKGIPCPHAVCAMYHRNLDPVAFISHWYHKNTFVSSYGQFIQPVRGMKLWPYFGNPAMIPPGELRKIGRPKKKRMKDKNEPKKFGKLSKKGVKMTCSNCKQPGHKKNKCLEKNMAEQPNPAAPSTSRSQPSAAAPPLSASQPNPAAPPLSASQPSPRAPPASASQPNPAAPPPSASQPSPGAPPALASRPNVPMVPSRGRPKTMAKRGTCKSSCVYKRTFVCGTAPPQRGYGLHYDNAGGLSFHSGSNALVIQPPKRTKTSDQVDIDLGFQPSGSRMINRYNCVTANELNQQLINELRRRNQSAQPPPAATAPAPVKSATGSKNSKK